MVRTDVWTARHLLYNFDAQSTLTIDADPVSFASERSSSAKNPPYILRVALVESTDSVPCIAATWSAKGPGVGPPMVYPAAAGPRRE